MNDDAVKSILSAKQLGITMQHEAFADRIIFNMHLLHNKSKKDLK